MTDIYAKNKRSQIMSRIRGQETKPEILVRKYLFARGFRYKKNDKTLFGKPDIVLPKYKAVVFVNGCFWHGHNCKAGKLPTTSKTFWKNKIDSNVKRDKNNRLKLRKRGWRVFTIWQCKIKNSDIREKSLAALVYKIKDSN
jgi:DNA mismatch endonuclease, patch repair protein